MIPERRPQTCFSSKREWPSGWHERKCSNTSWQKLATVTATATSNGQRRHGNCDDTHSSQHNWQRQRAPAATSNGQRQQATGILIKHGVGATAGQRGGKTATATSNGNLGNGFVTALNTLWRTPYSQACDFMCLT